MKRFTEITQVIDRLVLDGKITSALAYAQKSVLQCGGGVMYDVRKHYTVTETYYELNY